MEKRNLSPGLSSGNPPEPEKRPTHLVIVAAGNRRWAEAQGLPPSAGYGAAAGNLWRVLKACLDFGIPVVSFCFGPRQLPAGEMRQALAPVVEALWEARSWLQEQGIRLRPLGSVESLSRDLQARLRELVDLTRGNDRLLLGLALDYGGRAEIVEAVRRIAREGLEPERLDDALLSRYLYTTGLPDPDFVILTAGEARIPDLFLWQGAYAEYYVASVCWPDFDEEELRKALQDYARRERRFGGLGAAR